MISPRFTLLVSNGNSCHMGGSTWIAGLGTSVFSAVKTWKQEIKNVFRMLHLRATQISFWISDSERQLTIVDGLHKHRVVDITLVLFFKLLAQNSEVFRLHRHAENSENPGKLVFGHVATVANSLEGTTWADWRVGKMVKPITNPVEVFEERKHHQASVLHSMSQLFHYLLQASLILFL